ncbi:DUF4886 domain-containing protein [Novipirellula maiorica]|uniref:DUF4886 domain-containing protein n=1 Tax=Novipirellula maiorica TaxID=1265734 RepID=UPI00034585A4|nr:DUF4886 domain-containing protein [Rhodopirellula maiorica]
MLTIGNSFAQNACRYLHEIAQSEGSVDLVIGTANIGGCTLEKHATLAIQSATDDGVQPYRDAASGRKLSLQDYLELQPWDFVTVQQMSALSYKAETYHPHIDQLASLVEELAPAAELLIHQTWAYRQDSPLLARDNLSQQQMYERLRHAYDENAKRFDARIMPVGTAFQLARSTAGRAVVAPDPSFDYKNATYPNLPNQDHSLVIGWYWQNKGDNPRLALDFKHGNTHGCFLAGLVWFESLTGIAATSTSFVPKGISDEDAKFYRQIAHAACASGH